MPPLTVQISNNPARGIINKREECGESARDVGLFITIRNVTHYSHCLMLPMTVPIANNPVRGIINKIEE